MRKICVITGSRAEYGLLRWIINGILNSSILELNLIVTGMHLSPEFGSTIKAIEADGFNVDRKVEMLLSSDSPVGISKSMGLGLIGFADAFCQVKPDLVLVIGDRFEIFSAITAAMVARIPVAHIGGGDTSQGAIDEAIRHSITKMSHLHFVATDTYRDRVIQLGENPESVFLVGGLGIDNILKLKLLSLKELEEKLDFRFSDKNLLITFHPVTLEEETSSVQIRELLLSLENLENTNLIFTMPNADTEGRKIFKYIENFCKDKRNAKAYKSLGQLLYLSCLQYVDAVVGNSSSGLTEVPSFKKATINIGDRQLGRLSASSVINCDANSNDILKAIEKSYSIEFTSILESVKNPYGDSCASEKIIKLLEEYPLHNILKKKFFDVNLNHT